MILDEVRDRISTFCVLPDAESLDAVVLWVAATHAQPAWETATRLVIKAPAKRCGKSRLLDMVDALCFRPEMAANVSPAALIACIDPDEPPTLLLDEVDTIFSKSGSGNEALRGLLNAGHQRGRPYKRIRNGTRTAEPTFAMAALAGIGSVPDTIEDRAVIVTMRRRGPDETVSPYRRKRDEIPLRAVGFDLSAWVRNGLEWLNDHEPENPLEDRDADNWEPLLAIADLAEGDWPARARKAAVKLAKDAEESRTASRSEKLLADLRDVLNATQAGRISSEDLVAQLAAKDPDSWASLDPQQLGRMLAPYGVRPKPIRFGKELARGYLADMFSDTFRRYLKPLA